MKQKTISRNEWNRKVALARWKRVTNKVLADVKMKEKKPEYRALKAKILGYLMGDGGVYIRTDKNNITHHDILFCPDHTSMLTDFISAFKKLYGKEPSVRKDGGYYLVRAASKPITLDLLNTAKFGTLEWDVPLDYLDSDKLKVEWLKAFFDCEAYVGRYIQLQSVNKKGLYSVKELLEEFGIESRIYQYERKNPNWNTNYILCIMRKASIEKFYKKIGFNHAEKQRKLAKIFDASVPESG